jgi:hypothetical protein
VHALLRLAALRGQRQDEFFGFYVSVSESGILGKLPSTSLR